MSKPEDLWSNNVIQFTRLLAEIKMAGLGNETLQLLKKSMNVSTEQVCQILDRAEELFSAMKEGKHPEKVMIRWGAKSGLCEPMKDRTMSEHEYFTLEEMNAFLDGVDAAVGWTDHEQIDGPVECNGCKLIFDKDTLANGYCEECIQLNPECLEDCSSGGPQNCTGCMD